MKKCILVFLVAILMSFNLFKPSDAKAAVTQTTTITIGPFSDSSAHDYTLSINYLDSIQSITSDTGEVTVKSVDGDNVIVTVKNGTPTNAQTFTKEVQLDIPLVDQPNDGFTENDSNTMDETNIIYDSEARMRILPYPRYENWYRWTPNPDKPGTYMWGTVPENLNGYGEYGIKEYGGKIYDNLISQTGNYTTSDGYSVPYSQFQKLTQSGWYPRDGSEPGYITSDRRYGLPSIATEDTYKYSCPEGEPTSNTDSTLFNMGYSYIRVGAWHYTAHFHATATKSINNGYYYKLTINYTAKVTPSDNNHPPVPVINCSNEIAVLDNTWIYGSATDPDGDKIIDYQWSISPSSGALQLEASDDNTRLKYIFSQLGTYTIYLTVTDEHGATGSTEKTIKVVPPTPAAFINQSGYLKQNRAVRLDGSNSYSGSTGIGMNWDKTIWKITPITAGITQDDIKATTGFTGVKTLDLLFKKPGQYNCTLTVVNNMDGSDTTNMVINISPDLPPVANMIRPGKILRDPTNVDEYGRALAALKYTDNSNSPDGDIIAKRVWVYCYDSDNDGSFTYITRNEDGSIKANEEYETWYVFDNGNWRAFGSFSDIQNIDLDSINDGNVKNVQILTPDVGKYEMILIVREEFGQPTITQFITTSDKQKDDTLN